MDYRLADLLDVPSLNQMMESFNEIIGMAITVLDMEGTWLFQASHQEVCLKYHRCFPKSLERCRRNEETMRSLLGGGSLVARRCLNGMMDYAMPIVIEGEQLGALVIGQFFEEQPDESFFLQQARDCGFDEAGYLEAVRRVPVVSSERVGHMVKFLSQFVHTLTMMGLERLRKVRAEAAEAEQAERLKLALEGSDEGFWDWDLATGRLYISQRWLELTGYEPDEIEPHVSTWEELIHPQDRPGVMAVINNHLRGKTPGFEVEHRYKTKSGEWKWIVSRGKVVSRDPDGRPRRMAGTHTDITAHKQDEQELIQSQANFKALFDSISDFICLVDKEGRIVMVNEALKQRLGYQEEELINRSIFMLHPPVDQPEAAELARLMVDGMLDCCPMIFLAKDGEEIPVETKLRLGYWDQKEVSIGISRDITERLKAEEELREVNDNYRAVSELSSEFAYVAKMGPDGRFINEWISGALTSISGYTLEEAYAINHKNLLYPEDFPVFLEALKNVRSGACSVSQVRIVRKDGEVRWVTSYVQPVIDPEDNRITRIYGVIRDITESKLAEQERLEAKEAMSRAERLVTMGTLAAAVSHEIIQPLNYIKLTASSLLYWHKKQKQMEMDRVMDMIQEISGEVDRIEKTIAHLKTLVRKPEAEMELCDLNTAVGRALGLVGKQMEAHRVGLTLELEDKGMNVWATMTGLEEITINLLVNAIQALDTVEGQGKKIRVRTRVERKSVVLEVADNGPGVSEEMKQKIFEPFFTTKPAGENTGLGLAVVYTLAASYQGRIEVENAKPRGATFRMVLPRADG